MINFTPMINKVDPKTCILVNSSISSLSINQCVNLDSASSALIGSSNYITVNKTWINSINPNVLNKEYSAILFLSRTVSPERIILTNYTG